MILNNDSCTNGGMYTETHPSNIKMKRESSSTLLSLINSPNHISITNTQTNNNAAQVAAVNSKNLSAGSFSRSSNSSLGQGSNIAGYMQAKQHLAQFQQPEMTQKPNYYFTSNDQSQLIQQSQQLRQLQPSLDCQLLDDSVINSPMIFQNNDPLLSHHTARADLGASLFNDESSTMMDSINQ
jgi:hypothetical protein